MAQTGRKVSRLVHQLTMNNIPPQKPLDDVDLGASADSGTGYGNGSGLNQSVDAGDSGESQTPQSPTPVNQGTPRRSTLYQQYQSQMLSITDDMLNVLLKQYPTLQEDGGYLPLEDVHDALHDCNIKIPRYKCRVLVDTLQATHPDERITFEEFRELYALLKPEYDSGATYAKTLMKQDDVRTVQSATHGGGATLHSVSRQEQNAFAGWFERQLREDPECERYFPFMTSGDDLYNKCCDGILLCKLVNLAQPGTIVEKAINQPTGTGSNKQLSVYQQLENLNLALNSARALGCNIVNIGADDLQRAKEHLVLGLIWQLIKIGLTRSIRVAQRGDIAWMISEVRRETLASLNIGGVGVGASVGGGVGGGGVGVGVGVGVSAGSAAGGVSAESEEAAIAISKAQESFAMLSLGGNPATLSSETIAQIGEEMRKLTPEQIIIDWVNYHLLHAGLKRSMTNFAEDLRDSEIYAVLLSQIAPDGTKINVSAVNAEPDLLRRAELVIREAERFDAASFITPDSVVECNKNLNLAFLANLFNLYPAIAPASNNSGSHDAAATNFDYEEMKRTWETVFANDQDETREERTYRNWMNSMGVDPYVQYLYTDLRNALVLFQLYELIKPNVVDRKKVHERFHPRRQFLEEVENCNYAIHLGKSELKFVLVGIGGEDLHNGVENLTLGLVWQVMRAYTLTMLANLMRKSGIAGHALEKEIIDWVNNKLRSTGKKTSISGFHDLSLSDGRILLDLIDAIRPRSVKPEWVKTGFSDADKTDNAQLAITLGRKIGAKIYALPEDIVEVRPKMMLTIFACLMVAELEFRQPGSN